jgi:hypothetical protein
LGLLYFVEQAANADHIDGSAFQRQGGGGSVEKLSREVSKLKVTPNEAQLCGRRTANHNHCPVPSILKPICPQSVADAKQGFSGVLGKLQQMGNPATPAAKTMMFNV